MANTHTSLASLFTAIANAIRSKTGGTGPIAADSFPAAIAAIETGVDTSDATAAAGDVSEGKSCYVKGRKVVGTLAGTGWLEGTASPYLADGFINMDYSHGSDKVVLQEDAVVKIKSYPSAYGNAAPADVAAGKTFTSSAGLEVTGTAAIANYVHGTVQGNGTNTLSIPAIAGKRFVLITKGKGASFDNGVPVAIYSIDGASAFLIWAYANSTRNLGNAAVILPSGVVQTTGIYTFEDALYEYYAC